MRTQGMLTKVAIAMFFCLSLLASPLKASFLPTRVVDASYVLNEKSVEQLNTLLSEVATQGRADITVFLINQYTQNQAELAEKMIMEWEVTTPLANKIPHKCAYIIINVSSHQGMIVLGKDAKIDESLQYALGEIQTKILAPHLLERDVKQAVFLASQGMIGALEDWPVKVTTTPLFTGSFLTTLKWLAQISLIAALLFGLRTLFFQPTWQDLPISDEARLLLNQQASLGLSYWRTHRHIESV